MFLWIWHDQARSSICILLASAGGGVPSVIRGKFIVQDHAKHCTMLPRKNKRPYSITSGQHSRDNTLRALRP